MVEITIKLTQKTAREWQVALTDALNRRRGTNKRTKISLGKLCEIALYNAVAQELSAQAEDALKLLESEAANG